MSNFSQGDEEKDRQQDADSSIEDIQFEEVVDIDEIQKKLQSKIYENDSEIDLVEKPEEKKYLAITEEKKGKKQKTTQIITDANDKKYVIYIESSNVNFMENLSMQERKSLINKILKEQNKVSSETKEIQKRKHFFKHAVLVCFTVIIFFPLMFVVVNKAMEVTINNYQLAKSNFIKLYKEQGKIKMEQSDRVTNIKY